MKLILVNKKGLYKCDHPYVHLSVVESKDSVWIIYLGVTKSRRGNGLGLEAICEVMRMAGPRRPVMLFPVADDRDMQVELEEWYLKLGFRYVTLPSRQVAMKYEL